MKKSVITLIIGLVLLAVTIVGACFNLYNTDFTISGGTDIEVLFKNDVDKESYAKISADTEAALKKAGYKAEAAAVLSGNDYAGMHFTVNRKFAESDKAAIENAVKSVISDASVKSASAKPVEGKPYVLMLVALLIALVLTAVYVIIITFKKSGAKAMLTVIANAVVLVAVYNVVELILSLIGMDFSFVSVAMSAVVFIFAAFATSLVLSDKREAAKTGRIGVILAIISVIAAVLVVVFGGSIGVAVELLVALVLPMIAIRPMTNALYNVSAEGKNN